MLYKLLLAFQHFILTPFFCPLGRGSLLTPACAVAEPGTDRWGLETWRVCFVPRLHSHPASSIRTACPTSLPLYHKALMRQADKPSANVKEEKVKIPLFPGCLTKPGIQALQRDTSEPPGEAARTYVLHLDFLGKEEQFWLMGGHSLPPASPRSPLRDGFSVLFSRPDHLMLSSLPK